VLADGTLARCIAQLLDARLRLLQTAEAGEVPDAMMFGERQAKMRRRGLGLMPEAKAARASAQEATGLEVIGEILAVVQKYPRFRRLPRGRSQLNQRSRGSPCDLRGCGQLRGTLHCVGWLPSAAIRNPSWAMLASSSARSPEGLESTVQ
jgi:hypothetical protein